MFSASGLSLRGTLLPPFGVWSTRAGEGRGGEGGSEARAPPPGLQPTPRAPPSIPPGRGQGRRPGLPARSRSASTPAPAGHREPPEGARSPRRGRQRRPGCQILRANVTGGGWRETPPPGSSAGGQSAPPGGGAHAVSPAPAPPPVINAAAGSPAASSGGPGGGTIMQSAMFLAVHHDCGSMDKSSGSSPKSEEKREKMKRTL